MASGNDVVGAAPFSSVTAPPGAKLPPGATDCHHHIYDRRYATLPGLAAPHADADLGAFQRFAARLGVARHVVVQPSVYGTDNSCTLDAVDAAGGAARAIVVIDPACPRAELERMAARGARGIRIQSVGLVRQLDDRLERIATRAAELGWHVQLNIDTEMLLAAEARLLRLPAPIVIDHFARIPQPEGERHPLYRTVRRLLDAGRCWLKLSAAYHFSVSGPPDFADVGALARSFVRAAPERMLWGTDWPHPTVGDKPDSARLLDCLAAWSGDAATFARILAGNPAALYGF